MSIMFSIESSGSKHWEIQFDDKSIKVPRKNVVDEEYQTDSSTCIFKHKQDMGFPDLSDELQRAKETIRKKEEPEEELTQEEYEQSIASIDEAMQDQ